MLKRDTRKLCVIYILCYICNNNIRIYNKLILVPSLNLFLINFLLADIPKDRATFDLSFSLFFARRPSLGCPWIFYGLISLFSFVSCCLFVCLSRNAFQQHWPRSNLAADPSQRTTHNKYLHSMTKLVCKLMALKKDVSFNESKNTFQTTTARLRMDNVVLP